MRVKKHRWAIVTLSSLCIHEVLKLFNLIMKKLKVECLLCIRVQSKFNITSVKNAQENKSELNGYSSTIYKFRL